MNVKDTAAPEHSPAKPAPSLHNLSINSGRGTCSCGWKTEDGANVAQAASLWFEHVAEVERELHASDQVKNAVLTNATERKTKADGK